MFSVAMPPCPRMHACACMFQVALWPGLFSLLRLFGSAELASLRACLDPQLRDSLQTLLKHFKTAFKFGGRI